MMRAPIFDNIERFEKVGKIFRRILSLYGLESYFDEQMLHISPKVIVERTGNHQILSRALLDYMFPSEDVPCELFHYTNLYAFSKIVASQELHLTTLRKRMGQGELDRFAETHSLKGYLDSSAGEPYLKELSDDIFSVSFANSTARDSSIMWALFSECGEGVRLKFHLRPGCGDLRPIQYENPGRTLLVELNQALTVGGEPPFLPWTISRIGAFYLPSTLRYEGEVRLMFKRHVGGQNEARVGADHEYWPVPIGSHASVYPIKLCEIAAGARCDRRDIKRIVQNTQFETVSVI